MYIEHVKNVDVLLSQALVEQSVHKTPCVSVGYLGHERSHQLIHVYLLTENKYLIKIKSKQRAIMNTLKERNVVFIEFSMGNHLIIYTIYFNIFKPKFFK